MFSGISGLTPGRGVAVKTYALFGGGKNKEQEKEEMFRRQQAIIAERRSKSTKSLQAARERRRKLTAEAREKEEQRHFAREAMSRGEVPRQDPSYHSIDSDEESEFGWVMPRTRSVAHKHEHGKKDSVDKTETEPLHWIKGIFGRKKTPSTTSEED